MSCSLQSPRDARVSFSHLLARLPFEAQEVRNMTSAEILDEAIAISSTTIAELNGRRPYQGSRLQRRNQDNHSDRKQCREQ